MERRDIDSADHASRDRSYLTQPAAADLDHIPGDDGLPFIGRTHTLIKDLHGLCVEHMEKYGPVSRIGFNFQRGLLVLHPDQFQEIFFDRKESFSNTMGYASSIGMFYAGALLTQDFDAHRRLRRVYQRSFTPEAMDVYLEMMRPIVRDSVEGWERDGVVLFHERIRELLLDVAARVFFGLEDLRGKEAQRMNQAFFDIAQKGLMALLKYDVPGLAFHAGMRGKRFLAEYYSSLIPVRRNRPGRDLFSTLAQERDDDGELWSDDVLIPQLSLLQFASHDTTAGALSHTMMYLAMPKYRDIQERLRAVVRERELDAPVSRGLRALPGLEDAVSEALRLHPSVPLIPRRTVRACELGGHHVPAHTLLYLAPEWAQTSANWWTEPRRFDPDRFSEERAEHRRHRFAYVPFGGGPHKCIGMHFATLTASLVLYELLRRYRFTIVDGYPCTSMTIPTPKPTRGLPVRVERI